MDGLIRLLFIGLCVVGIITISFSTLFEYARVKQSTSVLTPFHFRWRALSALLWLLVLGSLVYAMLFLWPIIHPPAVPSAKAVPLTAAENAHNLRFVRVVVGSVSLLCLALLLTGFDAMLTMRERRRQQVVFLRDMERLAREEGERARQSLGKTNPPSGAGTSAENESGAP